MIPTALADRYRIEDRLAGGGMGTVYRATDERLGRRVAIKVLEEHLARDPSFVERFRREARAVAALVHPNIAGVFDYGRDDGRHYIVMELIEGDDLARLVSREGPLPVERALRLTAQLCDALGHAHAAGIVHRDVKPANAIVGPGDHVKVTDFGIARAPGDETLTGAGSVVGTAQYMSPEQASDAPVGPPSDVYSAGVVLFELLAGRAPFSGDSPISIALRHVSEPVPPPSRLRPDLPREIDELVARATAKRPEERFRDGAEMAAAVRRCLAPAARGVAPTAVVAADTAPAPRSTEEIAAVWPARASTRPRRWIGPLIALLVALALAAGALAAFTALDEDGSRRRRRTGGGAASPTNPSPTRTSTPGEPAPATVVVPDGLVGSNVEDAVGVLREAGLVPVTQTVESEEEVGTVIDAEPDEGTEVPQGSTVTLTASAGVPEESPSPEEGGDEEKGEGEAQGRGKGKGGKGGKGKDKDR